MNEFLLDTHLHFDLYKDRDSVVEYVEKNKIYTIGVTNLPRLYDRYKDRYTDNKYFRLALGFHPELAYEYHDQLPLFFDYIQSTRYIGEVGLDYSTNDQANIECQRAVFNGIVRQCKANNILSVHSRRADNDVLRILAPCDSRVIMHWYSGSMKNLNEALARNYYFSINHHMIKSVSGRKIVDAIPSNRLLIESDAPFTNGLQQSYNCGFITTIYDYLCYSRKLDRTSISSQIKENFRALLS